MIKVQQKSVTVTECEIGTQNDNHCLLYQKILSIERLYKTPLWSSFINCMVFFQAIPLAQLEVAEFQVICLGVIALKDTASRSDKDDVHWVPRSVALSKVL